MESLLAASGWFSLICQRNCWARNSVNLDDGRDRLKGAGLKNRQVSSNLLNKEKQTTALIGTIGGSRNFGSSLGAEAGADGTGSARREGCHLEGWSHAPVALSAEPTSCAEGVSPATSPPSSISPQHISTAFLHGIASASAVSSRGPRSDVCWSLRPQHRAAQLLEDTQSKPRFACHRPRRQNQEHCRQKSACEALTYPSAFRQQHKISCSPISASLSAAGSTKA